MLILYYRIDIRKCIDEKNIFLEMILIFFEIFHYIIGS